MQDDVKDIPGICSHIRPHLADCDWMGSTSLDCLFCCSVLFWTTPQPHGAMRSAFFRFRNTWNCSGAARDVTLWSLWSFRVNYKAHQISNMSIHVFFASDRKLDNLSSDSGKIKWDNSLVTSNRHRINHLCFSWNVHPWCSALCITFSPPNPETSHAGRVHVPWQSQREWTLRFGSFGGSLMIWVNPDTTCLGLV